MSRTDKRQEFLRRVGHQLRPEERSDFNIDRWMDSYENMDRCVAVAEEYVQSRRALALDSDEAFENFYARPDIRHYCDCFPQSKLDPNWVNPLDNGIVFVEMGPREPAKLGHLIRTGQFLGAFFAWCEQMLRLVLAQERASGRRSAAVCLFDMQQVHIWQYASPLGAVNRMFEMRVHLAMEYYAEMLSQVVILNPPRLVALLLKIMSYLLPARISGRFHIARSGAEAAQWIPLEAIPVGLGGTKMMEANVLPNGCIPPSKELGKEDFLKDGLIWESYSSAVQLPIQYEHLSVKAGQCVVRFFDTAQRQQSPALDGQMLLLYELSASRTFEMVFMDADTGEFLSPRLQLCTPQLAEEGAIAFCPEEHKTIRLEVRNVSKIFGLRLRLAVQLIDWMEASG